MPLVNQKLSGNGNLVFKVTNAPSVEPILAADVREYSRIDTLAEDVLLGTLIKAVRQTAEKWMGRALILQEITATLDWWPGVVKLPRPPLIDVVSIKTIDESDNKTVYSTGNYFVRTDIDPGEVVIKSGSSGPINTDRYQGGYEVVYECGYGEAASDVPESIIVGLLEWVSFAYENRVVDREPPDIALALLGAYKINRI